MLNNPSRWIGQIVRSMQGRDSGTLYLVIGTDSKDERLVLSDGRKHPVDQPKRKNIRHVKILHPNASAPATDKRTPYRNETVRALIAEAADRLSQQG